ncbi:T6SS phospholipase effector Tle1-like catalytic domain-containing protein [Chryseobacterium gambrini]|uniref:T6SS phospholipase effector Tle1-like catalytic domain-containing protein n=1 Tax=Chryseobacterium gambrini TaxID=373672 RepID=UPI003D0A56E2
MENNIISVGIFFDGTGNNGMNATSHKKPLRNNESYYGNVTNIYKLFKLFKSDEKKYVGGIGTVTGNEDSDFAMATCKNPAGYHGYSSDDKLEEAFSFIKTTIEDDTKEYHLYVYGFSRGAMLARNFCNKVIHRTSEFSEKAVKIKFLGVFDTVESAAFSDYDVAVLPETERVLHICAINECRYFFPLTGIFEESKERTDAKWESGNSVWKEIFVPGAHADVGGGYLEGSQSVYISPNFIKNTELYYYIENIKGTALDSEKNKIWSSVLKDYKIDKGDVFSQAYVARDLVYSELSKIYGKLMLMETNAGQAVFNTDFDETTFEIHPEKHPYLTELSEALKNYVKNLSSDLKPDYSYEKLADYTHISANFGLYHPALPMDLKSGANTEFINNGLNVPSHSDDQFNKNQSRLQSEIHHIEDSVVDYAYGTNIPNNDNWSRTILIKENFYNKC